MLAHKRTKEAIYCSRFPSPLRVQYPVVNKSTVALFPPLSSCTFFKKRYARGQIRSQYKHALMVEPPLPNAMSTDIVPDLLPKLPFLSSTTIRQMDTIS